MNFLYVSTIEGKIRLYIMFQRDSVCTIKRDSRLN